MRQPPLKSLLGRLRRQPDWKSPDPLLRAEAVLRLPAAAGDVLAALAREDPDARVRRSAVRRLTEEATLAAIVGTDSDEGVREEAATRLVHLAVHAQEDGAAAAAIAYLHEPRHLATVAKVAASASAREAAIGLLSDARALASVVREAEDTRTRLLALARIQDEATLATIALRSEHKRVALAAVDRLESGQTLHEVAEKARSAVASRRARSRLEQQSVPEATAPAAVEQEERDRLAYERARAELEREEAARARALAERTRLCEALEAAPTESLTRALEAARAAWAALPAPQGEEAAHLERRFAAAVEAARLREDAVRRAAAVESELESLVRRVEELLTAGEPAAGGLTTLEREWRERAKSAPPELRSRFEVAVARLRARRQDAREEQARREQENLARLLSLAERAEDLARQSEAPLGEAEHTMHEVRTALNEPGHFPTRGDRARTLRRLEAARRALYPRLLALREDAEWRRWANVNVQEELCALAEALVEETDLEKAGRRLHDLDARWRQAREAPREQAAGLRARFQAAREKVRARVAEHEARKAEEHRESLRRKQALCERAEALAGSSDWLRTAEDLRRLQTEWKTIGPVPRADAEKIWRRFRSACDFFFGHFAEHRAARDREWKANLERKQALAERAESLQASSDWESAIAELKRLQAEWKTIGPVRRSRSEAVWQRFRQACDGFFERYKNRDAEARERALAAREAILGELESLLSGEARESPPEDLVGRVHAAQTAWRQSGELPDEMLAPLNARFSRAREGLVASWPSAFAGSDLDPEVSRRRAERLAARVEELVSELGAPEATTAMDLASRIRDALAANTIAGPGAQEARLQAAAAEVEAARVAWRRLGPMPGPEGRVLAERFEAACRRFQRLQPPPARTRPTGRGRARR